MNWISITKDDLIKIKHIGSLRRNNAVTKGFTNYKIGKQSNYKTDLIGAFGEYCFCKHFGLDNSRLFVTGYLPKADAIYKGHTVDVKATDYITGHLLVDQKKLDMKCDLYPLLIVSGQMLRYKIVGFATAEQVFKPENINPRFDNSYALSQDKLMWI